MILFIDDEPRFIDSYVEYLRNNGKYTVKQITGVDDAIALIETETKKDKLQLIIMDIMMPPGESFKDIDTKRGLRTGKFLYEEIRKKNSNVPIAIFTNVSDPEVEDLFECDKNCKFMVKENYRLKDFLQEVKSIIVD